MVYDIALWVGLVLLAIGLIHRIDAWFLRDVGLGTRDAGPGSRVAAAIAGVLSTLFSVRIVGVLKVFVVDVLFQGRILRDARDPLAWVMHVSLFWGFILLLLFHALGNTFGSWIAPAYVPTLNPFLFMRNLFGLLLTMGLVLAVYRRVRLRGQVRTAGGDKAVIGLLATVALSGFLLEGVKITSDGEFARMVTDYTGGTLSPDETTALRTYWVAEYGLVNPQPMPSHDAAVVGRGKALHESYCQSCHARPSSAFVSYGVARAISPVAAAFDRAGAVKGLWWIHVLACCLGLPWIAFTKMFHVISTPASLIVAEVAGKSQTPATIATRQMIELDGCSHGGACHETCPVRVRRLERIGDERPYEPMMAYLGQKNASDLGSRPVSR